MLKLRINEILKKENRSMYWLSKKTGISANNIQKMCNGETNSIRFTSIETICKALNCSINDLFDSNDPTFKKLLEYNESISQSKSGTD